MQMIIGGEKVSAKSGEEIRVINPATREFIDTVPAATQEDIELCLKNAQQGKVEWANTPLYVRTAILKKCAEALLAHKEELAALLSKEMGKPITQAELDVDITASKYFGFAEKANHLGSEVMPVEFMGENDIIFTRREPLGVVAVIAPFNYPLILSTHKLAPALAAGNAVIVKPASDNPLAVIRLVELFLECGIPANVLQVVTGSGAAVGKWLVDNPEINAVSLTGSTAVGREVARYAAPYLHRVFLELGGNDPFIVFEDADLDVAIAEALTRTMNCGQTCMAPKRFIIHKAVKEQFVTRLIDSLKNMPIGDPANRGTAIGCLISEKAAMQVEEQVALTIRQGAKCIYGGKRFKHAFFEPTVLVDVTTDMDIAKDLEIFGPVFPIIDFASADEAVCIANGSKYGLSGAVISQDIAKALKTASQIESGSIGINSSGLLLSSSFPFGGYKMSGLGREGFSVGLQEFSQEKTYAMKAILK
jgi:succinate-semialdehyde dehydrogenase/glutarate-semialdehyde dehydrogenase